MQFDLSLQREPINGRVIAGFPGVGKSYMFKTDPDRYADSDSSTFDKSDFPANYIRHIVKLLADTDKTIFVSTHAEVREALVEAGIPYVLVYPELGLQDEYLQRYSERGSPEPFLNLMRNKWDDFVTGCQHTDNPMVQHIELQAGERLADVI